MSYKNKKINGFLFGNEILLSSELCFNKKIIKIKKNNYIEFIDCNDDIPISVFFKITEIIRDVDDGFFVICVFKGFKMGVL